MPLKLTAGASVTNPGTYEKSLVMEINVSNIKSRNERYYKNS